jgi:hypothetical protein
MERTSWPAVVERAAEIAESYEEGLQITVRQLYYRLVSERAIPHKQSFYSSLTANLARARRAGNFPSHRIVDHTRAIHRLPGWNSPGEFMDDMAWRYRRDLTAGQARALYVAAEKDTLRGLMLNWLAPYGIPVLVLRGQASQTYVDLVAKDVKDDGRGAALLYIGDFDASGTAIDQSFIERSDCWDDFDRIALNCDDVIEFNLLAAEGKSTDNNFKRFRSDPNNLYDVICQRQRLDPTRAWQWEVEAMEPNTLRAKVLSAVEPYIDHDVLDQVKREEAVEQRQLRLAAVVRAAVHRHMGGIR